MHTLSCEAAMTMIAAARRSAEQMGRPMSFAVVDGGGHPVAMLRMDGASILGATTVLGKACTAVYCQRPTHISVERARLFPEVYGSLANATRPPMVMSMGGFPLYGSNEVVPIGGFASSGGSGEQDIEASQAALAVWAELKGAAQ